MFDIGFPELALVSVVALLVLGPERLPEMLRSLGLWMGRLRRNFTRVKTEIEREIGMDEVRRQLHNEAVMEQMKQIERDAHGLDKDIQGIGKAASSGPTDAQAVEPEAPCEPPPGVTAPELGAAAAEGARPAAALDAKGRDAACVDEASPGATGAAAREGVRSPASP